MNENSIKDDHGAHDAINRIISKIETLLNFYSNIDKYLGKDYFYSDNPMINNGRRRKLHSIEMLLDVKLSVSDIQ